MKICGLCRPDDVRAAVDAGADAIGIVRCVSPRQVDDPGPLLRVAGDVVRIAVYRTWDGEDLDGFDVVQAFTFRRPPPIPALWAVRDGDALPQARSPLPRFPVVFVLDGPGDGGAGIGGDRRRAAALARRFPVALAGGLRAETVQAAIREVGPAAVDVSSGVERTPRCKDPARIRAFVNAARAAGEDSWW